MPLLRDSETGFAANRRGASECKPLLDAATKELYRKNAFRITGLPVDASSREVAKHADKLKLMEELGQAASVHTGAFALKPTLDEIREAIQRLKDPERRIIDELFWFWPQRTDDSRSDAALEALAKGDINTAYGMWNSQESDPAGWVVAMHNIAVMWHVCALDWENYRVAATVDEERHKKIEGYWRGCFARWEKLAVDDRFWSRLTARVRQLDDPRLTTGFVRRMRASLPEALDKINAELALQCAETGKLDLARLHLQFMRETNHGLADVEKIAELVLTPAKTRLKEQIRTAKLRADKNPGDAARAAKDLLEQARDCLALFDLFFGKENDVRNDLFDEVATVCNQLPITYHKATGDDTTCLEILKAVLPVATSIQLREQIQKNIGILSGNIRSKELDSIYTLLKAIQEGNETPKVKLKRFEVEAAPTIAKAANVSGVSESFGPLAGDSEGTAELFDSAASILRGISVDAWNTHRDRVTAITAIELALNYARDGELRSRLTNDRATLRQMAAATGQTVTTAVPSIASDRSKLVGWAVVIGIILVVVVLSNWDSGKTNSTTTPSYSPTYSAPSSSRGDTYRVPSYISSELDRDRQAIETQRALADSLASEVDRLGRELDTERLYLDRTSQYAVDLFNEKVQRYNSKLEQSRAQTRLVNQMVDEYNTKLTRYGR